MKPIPAPRAAQILGVSERTIRRAIAKNPRLLAGEIANGRGKATPLIDPDALSQFIRPDRRPSHFAFSDACKRAGCHPRDTLLRILAACARDGALDGDVLASFFREIYEGEVDAKIIDGQTFEASSMLRAVANKSHRPRGSWCGFLADSLRSANVNVLRAAMPAGFGDCWNLARREAVKSIRFVGGRVIPLSYVAGDTRLAVNPEFVIEAKNARPELVVDGQAIASLGFKEIRLEGDLMLSLWDFSNPERPRVKADMLEAITRVIRAMREDPMHGEDSWQSGEHFGNELRAACEELKILGVKHPKKIVAKFIRAWTRKERTTPPIRTINKIFHLSDGAR